MNPLSWMLPPSASTFAGDIDRLYYLILIITGIAFVVVQVGLVWFLIKYRDRPGRTVHYTHGSVKAEVIWTAVPTVTVVIIGLLSGRVWNQIKGRESVPENALPISILAKQFEWHVTYPGPDGVTGGSDDFTIRNQLHVPVGRAVVMSMTAEDVIHAFNVPAFRLKQDVVPGMTIRAWFQATEPGTYELGCAELCGLGHYRMRAVVTVHAQDEYDQWMRTARQTTAQR